MYRILVIFGMKYLILSTIFGIFGLLNIYTPSGAALFQTSKKMGGRDSIVSQLSQMELIAAIPNRDSVTSTSLKSPSTAKKTPVRYNFQITFDDVVPKVIIEEQFVWTNFSAFPTSEMYLHVYPNAYKNKSLFLNKNEIPAESILHLQLLKCMVNKQAVTMRFVDTDALNTEDSTVGKIVLPEMVNPGDSVVVECSYTYNVPRALGRMGYSPDKDYFFFSQWYIKPGVFENGKWICSPYFPYAEFYSDFADFNVTIIASSQFSYESSGQKTSVKVRKNNSRIINFTASGVHDFAWLAAKKFPIERLTINGINGKVIPCTIIYPEAYRDLLPRYITTLK
ncbi:MAG: hypothetical protein HYV28_01680, partial [Ignavibacteriales bacterium]|nr:hypothetical protein [Ignavibacteriales bacterium]